MEITPSNRGGSKLCYQGYLYTKHATRETNQWWKCVKRSSIGCRGNLSTTLQNENPAPGQPHNHAPSDTSITYSKTRNAMTNLATNTRDKPSQIFAQAVSQCDDNVQALLPVKKTPNAQFDTSVQLLQSQPPMQMSDCLRSTQQQPTVPAIRQRPECRKQNVSLLLTRQFRKISQCPDLLHLHGRYLLCSSAPIQRAIHHPGSIQRCNRHCSICVPAK